jgi:hypothetical protein
MSTRPVPTEGRPPPSRLHAAFLRLLPRIERHGLVCFRDLRCPGRRADAVAEVVALAWKWFLRLAERGKDASAYPSALAAYAARAVRAGRRLCGRERGKDALSPRARRHGFVVHGLPGGRTPPGGPLDEALRDNTRTPVPDQASFRCDFPAWLATRTERDRQLIGDLMLGERTLDAARKRGLSPGRVSQLRRRFMEDWARFCDAP